MLPLRPLQTGIAALVLNAPADCDANGAFQCKLDGVLHLLYAAGAVLGVLFLIVAVIAWRVYRNNRNSKDIRP